MNVGRIVLLAASLAAVSACRGSDPPATDDGDDGDDTPAAEWGDEGETGAEAETGAILPDVPAPESCDLVAQDCPLGQKCNPVDAGTRTSCVPLVDEPLADGEPCSWVGGLLSGFDPCEQGSWCAWADDNGDNGVCRSFCSRELLCSADELCTYVDGPNSWNVPTCLPRCDPRIGCEPGYSCVADDLQFACLRRPGEVMAGPGEYCGEWWWCETGSMCQPQGDFGSTCVSFCTLGEACSAPFSTCVPYYDIFSEVPPGLENLGYCI